MYTLPSAPAAPTNLRNTTIYSDRISLSWDFDESFYVGTIVKYVIFYNEVGSQNSNHQETVGKTLTISNLKSGTSYEFTCAVSESRYGTGKLSQKVVMSTNNGKKNLYMCLATKNVLF